MNWKGRLLVVGACVTVIIGGIVLSRSIDEVRADQGASPELVLETWEGPNGGSYLYKPAAVTMDSDGNIFVLDAGNQRIAIFDRLGAFRRAFGRAGQGPSEFNFGTDPEDEIAVDRHFIVVLEKQRRLLHVFDHRGTFVDRFALSNDVHSMALRDGRIVVSLLPEELGKPTIVEYSIHGERLRELGSAEFTRELRLLNKGFVAADTRGNIRQAQLFFPMVRRFAEDGRATDEWYDFSWWVDEDARVRAVDGQKEADRTSLRDNPQGKDLMGRHSVFWDLEYASAADEWVGLVYGPIIQTFTGAGEPKRYFVPWDGLSESERDGWPWDIGVDPSAERVCVAFFGESKVRCYRMPD